MLVINHIQHLCIEYRSIKHILILITKLVLRHINQINIYIQIKLLDIKPILIFKLTKCCIHVNQFDINYKNISV